MEQTETEIEKERDMYKRMPLKGAVCECLAKAGSAIGHCWLAKWIIVHATALLLPLPLSPAMLSLLQNSHTHTGNKNLARET